jgi:ankyrin repeat protein
MPLISAIANFNGQDLTEIEPILRSTSDVNALRRTPKEQRGENWDIQLENITALTLACEKGLASIVDLLLTAPGINPNLPNGFGDTPLILACRHQKIDVVEKLLQIPAVKFNLANKQNQTPFFEACQSNNVELYRLLWRNQRTDDPINLQHKNQLNYTAFEAACIKNADKIVKLFFEEHLSEADINSPGFMPLHLAARFGSMKVLNLLLKDNRIEHKQWKVVNILMKDSRFNLHQTMGSSDKTPLAILLEAYKKNPADKNIKRILLDIPDIVEILDNEHRQNHNNAIESLLLEVITERITNLMLLFTNDLCFSFTAHNYESYQPYFVEIFLETYQLGNNAVIRNHFSQNKLVESEKFIEKIQSHFNTRFSLKINDMRSSIQHIISPNIEAIRKTLAVFNTRFLNQLFKSACREEFIPIIKALLIDERIDVNQPDAEGKTLLWNACEIDSTEVVHTLLSCSRVEQDRPNHRGETAAQISAELGHKEILTSLNDNTCGSPNNRISISL